MEGRLQEEFSAEFARDKRGHLQKEFNTWNDNQVLAMQNEYYAARYSMLSDDEQDKIRITRNNMLMGKGRDNTGLTILTYMPGALIPNSQFPERDLNQDFVQDLINIHSGLHLASLDVVKSQFTDGLSKSAYPTSYYVEKFIIPGIFLVAGVYAFPVLAAELGAAATAGAAGEVMLNTLGIILSTNEICENLKGETAISPLDQRVLSDAANDRAFREHILNNSGTFPQLNSLIQNGVFTDDTSIEEFYGRVPYDLNNVDAPINTMKRFIMTNEKVAQEIERISNITDPYLKKKEAEKFLNKAIETQHEVVESCRKIVSTPPAKMSKQELFEAVAYYENGAMLVARSFTLGLSFFNFNQAAEYFQQIATPMISLSAISAKFSLNLISSSTAVFAASDIVLRVIQWAIGKPQASLVYYFDLIRKQLEQIQQQLSYICEVQSQILKSLEELTRLIHINHAELMREVSRIKSELTEFHLSMFSDERQDKLMRLYRHQNQLQLLLDQDVSQFNLVKFSSTYHKVFTHAVSVSRLVQFSGDRFGTRDLDDTLEKIHRHNRTDLTINYLISLCMSNQATRDVPNSILNSEEAIPNPTEWIRASSILLNALFSLPYGKITEQIPIEVHLQTLYRDGQILTAVLAMLGSHKNIKCMIKDFLEKLPVFLSESAELVDTELAKQLEKCAMFSTRKSISKKETLPLIIGGLYAEQIDKDVYFLRDFVVQRGARYTLCTPSILVYDPKSSSLHSIEKLFGMDILSPQNFTVLTQPPKQVNKGIIHYKPKHDETLYDNKSHHVYRQCFELSLTLKPVKNNKPITVTGRQFDYQLMRHSTSIQKLESVHLRVFEFPNWRTEIGESDGYETFFDFLYASEHNKVEFLRQSIMHNLLQKIRANSLFSEKTLQLHQTYQELRAQLTSIVAAASINQLYHYIGYSGCSLESLFSLRYTIEDPLKLLIRTAFSALNKGENKKTFSQATSISTTEVTLFFKQMFKSILFNLNIVNPHTAMPLIAMLQQKIVLCAYEHNTRLSFFGNQKAKTFMKEIHEKDQTTIERIKNPRLIFEDLLTSCQNNDLAAATRLCGFGVLQLPNQEDKCWKLINDLIIHLNADILDVVLSHLGKRRIIYLRALAIKQFDESFLKRITDPTLKLTTADTMIEWLESINDFISLFNRLTTTTSDDTHPKFLSTYNMMLDRLRNIVDDELLDQERNILKEFYGNYCNEVRSMCEHLKSITEINDEIDYEFSSLTLKQILNIIRDDKILKSIFFSNALKLRCNGPDSWIKGINTGQKIVITSHNNLSVTFSNEDAKIPTNEITEIDQKACLENLINQFKYMSICRGILFSIEMASCKRNFGDALNVCQIELSNPFQNLEPKIVRANNTLNDLINVHTNYVQQLGSYAVTPNLVKYFSDEVDTIFAFFQDIDTILISSFVGRGVQNQQPAIFTNQWKHMGINIDKLKKDVGILRQLCAVKPNAIMKTVSDGVNVQYLKHGRPTHKRKEKYKNITKKSKDVVDEAATNAKYLEHLNSILAQAELIQKQLTTLGLLSVCSELLASMPWQQLYDMEYGQSRIKFFQSNDVTLSKLAQLQGATVPRPSQNSNANTTNAAQQNTAYTDDVIIPTPFTLLGSML